MLIELSFVQRYLYYKVFQNFAPALQATPLCFLGLHFGVWAEFFKRQGKETGGNWKIHKFYLCQQAATSTPCKSCQGGESLVSQPRCPWKQGKNISRCLAIRKQYRHSLLISDRVGKAIKCFVNLCLGLSAMLNFYPLYFPSLVKNYKTQL